MTLNTLLSLLIIIGIMFFFMYVLWGFYLAVMPLMRARNEEKLSTPAKFFGYPILGLGYLIDFLNNVFVATFLFMELPKEWVVTARLIKYINGEEGYRKAVATWICNNLLDPFDPTGCHCKRNAP